MESQHLAALRVLAAVAWADGTLAPEEADALARLIEACPDLVPRERVLARRFLEEKVEVDPQRLQSLGPGFRERLYHRAVQMAGADRTLADAELALLSRLRQQLGLPPA